MRRVILHIFIFIIASLQLPAQNPVNDLLGIRLQNYFRTYKPHGIKFEQQPTLLKYELDDTKRTLCIFADDYFGTQEFTPDLTEKIYKNIRKIVPQPYNAYQITVYSNNLTIDELIPNRLSENTDTSRMWGDINYTDLPWVTNASSPVKITHGLQNRHLSVWASHGKYFNVNQKRWEWQRPGLFGTCEDLFTQTIVIPYLIPMLQNAGAIVFTPRERDWQKNEVIVDNDTPETSYMEEGVADLWMACESPGFAFHPGSYNDGENPFEQGTARMAKAVSRRNGTCDISYTPDIPEAGRYAVYVSYQSLPNSIPDAVYTVWHRGCKTTFKVNQTMGGGTWVYLGTFSFDQGSNRFNRVTLSNASNYRGVVTADAVRFGGGMGNISRDGIVSGLPRCLEGARYYAQWAGMKYDVYSSKNGMDDYGDDINARSYMTNFLSGGSVYVPSIEGRKVPIELSLAIHSDAGYVKNDSDLIGSLAICTTNYNDGKLNAGISRLASRDLADALLTGITRDIKYTYGKWNRRELFDRNYSETRNPEVPSAIMETMSHQNFNDMKYGQDPNFRFTFARSIYKTLLRYICDQHGAPFIMTPLAPNNFFIEQSAKGDAILHWSPVNDPQEPSARATGYVVYTASGHSDFDNGTYVGSKTTYSIHLEPGELYHFKVSSVNRGGESFTSETLTTLYRPNCAKTILIVNGFHRLSSPAVIDNDSLQGFDLEADPGVSYGRTAGWLGRQTNFNRKDTGKTLGASSEELAGTFIAGNDFDYPSEHGEAIKASCNYAFVSCSSEAVEKKLVNLHKYAMVDLILGLEKNDGHSLVIYKTFTPTLRNAIADYARGGGSLLVSGAYVGSDMTGKTEQKFLKDILKCTLDSVNTSRADNKIKGMNTDFDIYREINGEHYAATSTDILHPVAPAYCALLYPNGTSACVAYSAKDYRCLTMGFPFECIKEQQKRNMIMNGIIKYLIK